MATARRRLVMALALLLFSSLWLTPRPIFGQVLESVADGAKASFALDKLKESILDVIDAAGAEGDYLLQQAGLQALIALQTLEGILSDQQDTLWRNVDSELRTAAKKIEASVHVAKEGFLEMENFVAMDVTALLDEALPFLDTNKPLRRIDGASQFYVSGGTYEVRLLGTAFDPSSNVTATLGSELGAVEARSVQAHELRISVDADLLNPLFEDGRVSTVPLQVSVEGPEPSLVSRLWPPNWFKEPKDWAYSIPIRLIPRSPVVGYTLVEYQSAKIPGDAKWSPWGSEVRVRQAGRDCKRHESCANEKRVCVAVPLEAEVVKVRGRPKVGHHKRGCGSWCTWTGHPWIGNQVVCQNFKNWRKSYDGHVKIRVQYRPLTDGVISSTISLSTTGAEQVTVDQLEFGKLYHAVFSEKYASFDLDVSLFNGETISITPGVQTDGRSSIVTWELEALDASQRRLVIKILPQA